MFEATLLEYGYISATANDAFSKKLNLKKDRKTCTRKGPRNQLISPKKMTRECGMDFVLAFLMSFCELCYSGQCYVNEQMEGYTSHNEFIYVI